ncbi:sugar phosphate nucleotidyltransferase [Halanaeroarchaeum sulfurireducens]|uniref:Glucose-1-phosphate thymidylyltransferase n=1 Tax=Halanaeroarchaeum sulfurireducens TaxID=1604004 RepID=A0A0N9N3T7_9EURY|nr:sugar phosphate nucleotidyltransferase [Halanaeroarchaeum sulfurireducens]ALG81796.1 glucose-1-phosphate thymidylyltransferase [Halanaeroarchaeum sulfurireducens]
MQAVIPAAGEGTRLRPLTDDRPKPMVEIAGEPLLTHVFRTLLDEVEEFVVVVGYELDAIVSQIGEAFRGVPITYVHQREQRGLAHAVSKASSHVDGQFVVLNGDNVFGGGVGEIVERARETDSDAVLAVESVPRETARQTGVVETSARRVTGLVEKPKDPPSRLVTTGLYVLPEEVFSACQLLRPSDRGEYELTGAVDVLVRAGATVEPVRLDGERVNVNAPADIERAAELLDGE